MRNTRGVIKLLCWFATGSLIVFCLLFGFPFVSRVAAGKVIEIAGCRPPTFDMQAICPTGSFAEPFVPLSHWFTSALAPFVLVQNFGGMLLAWVAICIVLFATFRAFPVNSAP